MEAKLCSKCRAEKPLGEFYWFAKQKGYSSQCKRCTKARLLAKRTSDPGKDNAYQRAQYLKHHEKRMAYAITYRADPEHKELAKQRTKAWYAANPERAADHYKRRNYAMEPGEYERMVHAQESKCAACGKKPTKKGRGNGLHVDHDHATGKVRALLCAHCNMALGHAMDDPSVLEGLLSYLGKR